jgi:hypothetical protein
MRPSAPGKGQEWKQWPPSIFRNMAFRRRPRATSKAFHNLQRVSVQGLSLERVFEKGCWRKSESSNSGKESQSEPSHVRQNEV